MDLKSKKILVTGGTGFLGTHLVRKLQEDEGVPEVNIIVPRSSEFDLRTRADCEKVMKGIDVVIHLAAHVGGIGYNREHPAEIFFDNASMALNLIDTAHKAGVEKFVGIGSVCAYPKVTEVPFKEEHLWDGYPEETNGPYGMSKKVMLVQSKAYHDQYDWRIIHLLPVNFYGPGDDFHLESCHVIPALIKKMYDAKEQKKEFIEVWGTGKATREFIYIEDVADGVIAATKNYEKLDPVNIGSGMEISIKDLAETIQQILGYKGELRWDTSKPDGQMRRSLNTDKAQEEFGFKAKVNFNEGLEKTIAWYLKTLSKQP